MSSEAQSRADAWVAEAPEGSRERELRTRAREWADRVSAAAGMSGGWRMQVLSLRTRRDFRPASGDPASGLATSFGTAAYAPPSDEPPACPDRPMRVRRFVSGCPWPLVERVVRYLHVVAPYTGVVVDGSPTEASWRPTLTQWTRDAQSQAGADATCTLVQDLVELTECGDSETVATGASCLQYEETRYEWDASSVEAVSGGCPGQGVSVSVQAVRRNEDGTFDYQVVTSRARSRHVAKHAVQCDRAHSATEERWENLYGEPGSLRVSGLGGEPAPCDGFGTLPDFPADSCSTAEAGVSTRWEVQLNRDCTYSVSKTVSTALSQGGSWADADGCRVSSHSVTRGSASAPPSVQSASPGTRVDVRATLADDGTWSWERTEASAPDSVDAKWRDGTPCRPRAVTHRLDARSLADAKAVIPPRSVGQVVDAQVSRNQDCTWDARVAVTKAPEPGYERWTDGSECRPRRHARGMNYRSFAAAKGAASGEHPLEAGWTVDAQYSRNEDCTWDFTSVKARASAEWEAEWKSGTACAPTSHTAWRGQLSVPSALGQDPQPGETVRASLSRNEDCTFDAERSVTTRAESGPAEWTEGSPCRPVAVEARWGAASVDVPGPAQGESVSVSVRRNEDCTYDVERRVRTRRVQGPVTWTDGSPASRTSHEFRDGLGSVPSTAPGGVGVSVRARASRAEDCTYEYEKSETTSVPDVQSWDEGSPCAPVHTTIYDHVTALPSVGNSSGHTSASFRREDDGTYSGSVRVQTPVSDPGSPVTWTTVERSPTSEFVYECTLQVFSHVEQVPVPSRGSSVSVSVRLEDDCTYSGQITTRTLVGWADLSAGGGGGGGGGGGSEEYVKNEYFVYDGYLYVNAVKYRVYKPSGITVVVSESGPVRGERL